MNRVQEVANDANLERVLRRSVAVVWIVTGALVLHPYFRAQGALWLGRLGLGPEVMIATCACELALGALLFVRTTGTLVAVVQSAAIFAFTAILGALDPMLLVHPFGVLSKNLPLLAVIWTAWLLAREGPSARAAKLLATGMAIVWITEGLFPKLLFQQALETDMLTRWGLSLRYTRIAIAVTGALQVASGIAAFTLKGRPLAYVRSAQLAALVFFPAAVTLIYPEAWLHPFGPLTKNIPILAGTFVLLRRWPPTSR